MHKYLLPALLCFAGSVVFAVVNIFSGSTNVSIGIYVCFALYLVFIAFGTRGRKYAPTVFFADSAKLEFSAFFASFGLLVDFVASCVEVYQTVKNARAGVVLMAAVLVAEAMSALCSSVCFLMISLSYSRGENYDFRVLGVFNLSPLLWILFRTVVFVMGVSNVSGAAGITYCIALALGIFAMLRFAVESLNDGCTSSFSLYCFRTFGAAGLIAFLCAGYADAGQIAFCISLLCVGVFTHRLSVDILSRTNFS